MTLREEFAQVRIKNIMDKESEFDFPEFVRCIRKSLSLSRKEMSKEMGIHEMKLYYLEFGKFKRMPELWILTSLADYFGMPKEILIHKAKMWISKDEV